MPDPFAWLGDLLAYSLLAIAVVIGSQRVTWLMAGHVKQSWIKRLYDVPLLVVVGVVVDST